MAGARALERFLAVCDEARIDVVVVKGAVTSFLLYDDVAERPVTDVDARVRGKDRDALRRAAERRGFRVLEDGGPYEVLTLLLGDVAIDVECHIGPPGMTPLPVDALLASATLVEHPRGFRVPVPDLEHHALVLAINCFKDRFVRATPWALEDARRVVRQEGFSAERLIALSQRARLASLIVIVAEHLGGEPWRAVGDGVRGDARRSYLALYRWLARGSRDRAAFRALTRVACDAPRVWPEALARAAWLEWDRRREPRR